MRGDLGGVVAQDLSLRYDGLVERLCLFNTIPPLLADGPPPIPRATRMAADYFIRQSKDADGLAAELDTPERRRRYIATFYGSRFWAAPGSFEREDVERMTEPFADPTFRAIANRVRRRAARAPEPPSRGSRVSAARPAR